MPTIPTKVPAKIECNKVLLVERDDEVRLFEELIKFMGWTPNVDIQMRKINGKDNRDEFEVFLNDPGFPIVKGYAIIRDADTNAGSALQSVRKLLSDQGQPCSMESSEFESNGELTVGIFIMPGHAKTGMLEDLCLLSVKDHPVMPHVEGFMSRVQETMQDNAPKNESKAKTQAFLSAMHKPVPHLGVAAQCGYWPFDKEAFSNIREFIERLMKS